jgi:hypothetical protein
MKLRHASPNVLGFPGGFLALHEFNQPVDVDLVKRIKAAALAERERHSDGLECRELSTPGICASSWFGNSYDLRQFRVHPGNAG